MYDLTKWVTDILNNGNNLEIVSLAKMSAILASIWLEGGPYRSPRVIWVEDIWWLLLSYLEKSPFTRSHLGEILCYQLVSTWTVRALTSRVFRKHLTYIYLCFHYIILHTSVIWVIYNSTRLKCIVLSTQTFFHLHALSVIRYMSFPMTDNVSGRDMV